MIVEDIEVNSSHQGITNGALLVEESWICTGFYIVPYPPFIHYQGNPFRRIVLIHYFAVTCKQFIHNKCSLDGLKIFRFGKIKSRAFMCPVVCNGIMVQRYSTHLVQWYIFHKG